MKKRILIICTVLTIVSLTSFAYTNWNNKVVVQEKMACSKAVSFENIDTNNIPQFLNLLPNQAPLDLIYNLDSRFMTTITKEKLHHAKSVIDIFPKRETDKMESYEDVKVAIMQDDKEISLIGTNENLTKAQLKLLKSTDYSTNFYLTANCKMRTEFGQLRYYNLVYYMTVVPEKEAEYTNGQDAVIEYIKENLKDKTTIITEDKLKPGRVSFTVTKDGTIANVKLESTSGYVSIDKELVNLITNMPNKWNAATNSKGKKVAQEFVFFFGLQGC